MTYTIFNRDNNRRPINAFDNFGSGNTNYASVPSFACQDCYTAVGMRRLKLDQAYNLFDYCRFDLLPLYILRV